MKLKFRKAVNLITSSLSRSSKIDVAIVTDSTADLPPELVEKNQITVIPAILIVDGKSLVDGDGITRQEFYRRMPTMETPPTTATPSLGTFEDTFEALLKRGYRSILAIHVSSMLSGIYNTAKAAAQQFKENIHVVDSGQISLGVGYQVLAAAEAAATGLPLETILQEVNRIRQKLRVVAMLDTLEYVRRSGRVSWAKARIGSLLHIKPYLEIIEGKVLSLGQVRTRKKGITGLINMFFKTGEIEKLSVLHTNAERDAKELLSRLSPELIESALIVNVTTIIGTHVGPNALGFAVVRK